MLIDAEDLRRHFHFDPENDKWTRLYKHKGKKFESVGWLCWNGYRYTRIHGQTYTLHRLAWLYVNGEWPAGVIDHINHDRADNRIVNLRVCTVAENSKNICLSSRNKSGHVGVSWDTKNQKWAAAAKVNKKTHHLGRFEDKATAAQVVKDFRSKHGFSDRHGDLPIRRYLVPTTSNEKA